MTAQGVKGAELLPLHSPASPNMVLSSDESQNAKLVLRTSNKSTRSSNQMAAESERKPAKWRG